MRIIVDRWTSAAILRAYSHADLRIGPFVSQNYFYTRNPDQTDDDIRKALGDDIFAELLSWQENHPGEEISIDVDRSASYPTVVIQEEDAAKA